MGEIKLKRLKIEKYRNVAPGTELVFNDTFNVLLGRNGTGKTTLLKLIAMVVEHNFAPLKDEEFAFEYELAYPDVTVTVKIENRRQENAPQGGHLQKPHGPSKMSNLRGESLTWSYLLDLRIEGADSYTITSNPMGASYQSSNKSESSRQLEVVPPFDDARFFFMSLWYVANSLNNEHIHNARLATTLQKHAYSYGNNGRFDETLGGFQAMCGTSGRGVDVGLASSEISFMRHGQGILDYPYGTFCPASLLSVLGSYVPKLTVEALTAESISLPSEHINYLRKSINLFGFESGEMILRLLEKNKTSDKHEQWVYGSFSFLFALDQGSAITQHALSYGQKRLLSFLYYVDANPDIIIADELVNGMHYDWIEACVDAIADRQSFLTSQNPLLLDFLPFHSPEEVQKSFLQCSREDREGRTALVWKNLSEDDARSFYRAYTTGVQHVSEILRTKGLW